MTPLAIIFTTVFIDLLGFGIIIPLLPFYAEHYGAAPHEVALLMTAYSLAQFLAAPFWGGLSDRRGRKPVLVASLIGIALSYLWLASAGSLAELFAARLAAGAFAGNIAAAQAYVADVTAPEERARGMGLIGAAFGLGFTLGPAVGGLLGGSDPAAPNVVLPAGAAAGLSLTAALFAFLLLPEAPRRAEGAAAGDPAREGGGRPPSTRLGRLLAGLREPQLGWLLLLLFLLTFAFAGMESTFALWSERSLGWGPRQNGALFAALGLFGALVQGLLVGPLARRFGERALVLQGSAGLAIGLAGVALAGFLPAGRLALLAAAVMGLAYGVAVALPATNALLSRRAAREERGRTLGVGQSASSLARMLGPAGAGTAFTLFGPGAPYLLGALVVLLAFLLVFRLEAPGPEA